MIGNVGKLWVSLGIKDTDLKRGLKSNERLLAGFGRRLAIAGAAAGTAAVGGIAVLARQSLGAIDAQAKLARDLGTTTASMQVMERAGQIAGVGMSGIAQATKDLTRRLSQAADGTGPAVNALGRLNLSAQELMKLPLDERIGLINDRIEEFVPVAARAAVSGQLFGEEGSIAMARLNNATLSQAVSDVERFGVAVSEVDAAQIERTNDSLSRMSLIGQGLGNQVAIAVAPALERTAEMMGRIFEVGSPVSSTISLVAANLDRVAIYAGVAAAALGIKYAGALVIAAARTATLSGTLVFLRGALIRTGIGAFIVLAGELIFKFSKLVSAAGGFGNALTLLKDVAVGVWAKIKAGGDVMYYGLALVFNDIEYAWIQTIGKLATNWGKFVDSIAGTSIGGMMGIEGGREAAAGLNLAASMKASTDAMSGIIEKMSAAQSIVSGPTEGMQALRDLMAQTSDETASAVAGAKEFSLELQGVASNGLGSGSSVAADGVAAFDGVTDAVDTLQDRLDSVKSTMQSYFTSLVSGGKSFGDVLSDIGLKFTDMLANKGFEGLWSGGLGALVKPFVGGLKMPAYANGTSYHSGGFAQINERGGEIVNLPSGAQVIPHDISKRMAGGGGGDTYHIDARGAQEGVADQILAAIRQAAPGIQAGAVNTVQTQMRNSKSWATP